MDLLNDLDLLIVGAGPVGCTIAERAATLRNWKSVIIDKREHLGGNCHDCLNDSGQLIHKYGPHYFRTNYERVFSYLSKFTDWIPGDYIVKSSVNKILYPFPVNLSTLEKFFDTDLTESEAKELLTRLAINNPNPMNSEEFILSRMGKELYESFYLGYTQKQWGLHPKELDPKVCGRVPIRFNRDDSYVDAKYKFMPREGYTKMFSKMISSDNITFSGNTNFKEIKNKFKPKIATIYTGPIDEYFNHCLGKLPWRSLEFEWKTFEKEFIQPCVQINFPNDNDYTRSVEIKHVTKQKMKTSTISFEYPNSVGDPYYPILQDSSSNLYQKYKQLTFESLKKEKVFFVGRLAEYTYINTDEAIKKGLETFDNISSSNESC
jgi:UDP-galactopyranose mutase